MSHKSHIILSNFHKCEKGFNYFDVGCLWILICIPGVMDKITDMTMMNWNNFIIESDFIIWNKT